MMTILSLCDFTGEWSRPYRAAGYDVIQVDLQHGHDVRLLRHVGPVRGILAAPPCTEFASSGSRWWAGKGDAPLISGLSVVDACMRIIFVHKPLWWALENPVGRLRDFIGEPAMAFDPCDYGDPYTKRTLLWGTFRRPRRHPVEATEGSRMHLLPPSPQRAALRSVTPAGFAQSFYEANP
jgi:hypothetical protein